MRVYSLKCYVFFDGEWGFRSGVYSFKSHVFVDKIATVVIFSLWMKYISGSNCSEGISLKNLRTCNLFLLI